ncbi:Zinc finger MYM-type protein 1 [Orchesella cincta]|uniref:Zinc finger MYM-type protein 1 n=1 Tax=Orchesella cincta TaxID=48709 RepID=A0A1D2M0V2_ORCCI|nr:Zinc finger MYM-type protein 1 [Orchesella cincta]
MAKRKQTFLDNFLSKKASSSSSDSALHSELSVPEKPGGSGLPTSSICQEIGKEGDSAHSKEDENVPKVDLSSSNVIESNPDVLGIPSNDDQDPGENVDDRQTTKKLETAAENLSQSTLAPENPSRIVSENAYQPSDWASVQHVGKRHFNFQQSWFQTFPWLHLEKDIQKMLCIICVKATRLGLHRANTVKEETFLSTGFCNWKKAIEKCKKHESSNYHTTSLNKLAELQNVPIKQKLQTEALKVQETARLFLRKIITSVLFLAKQGLALRGNESDSGNFLALMDLRSEDVEGLSAWLQRSKSFTSWAIQNEVLRIASHSLLRQVMKKIENAKYYSVIVDETTDSSVKEQVSLNIRIVDEDFEAQEYFMGLYETEDTTGNALYTRIIDALQRFNLSLENLRGQCYDGAANMSGKFKGVKAKILELQPKAFFVHCFTTP